MSTPKIMHQVIHVLICIVLMTVCCQIETETITSPQTPVSLQVAPTTSQLRDYWPTTDWQTAFPEKQGMNDDILQIMDQTVVEQLPQIRSILIVRHGYLVFEKYYQGYDRNSFHEIHSAGKSFVSALIGIALQSQYLDSIDQKVLAFFPEYITPDLNPRVREITLEHLLTMTAGYGQCGGAVDCSPELGEDPIKYALEQSITASPGHEFQYNNATVNHLLVETLARATKMDILEFAKITLCEPLGMSGSCERLIKDITFKPRDMAKFGYLYLNQGLWDEKQIVSAEWVKSSIQRQNAGGSPHGVEYGYLFWVTTVEGYSAYFAGGYGGQFIYVVPDLDIVVVITSNFDQHYEENRRIVGRFIIPSVMY